MIPLNTWNKIYFFFPKIYLDICMSVKIIEILTLKEILFF